LKYTIPKKIKKIQNISKRIKNFSTCHGIVKRRRKLCEDYGEVEDVAGKEFKKFFVYVLCGCD